MRAQKQVKDVIGFPDRRRFLFACMLGAMALLVGRAVQLQIMDKGFLQRQGNIRHVSEIAVSAYRGKILDRNGEPLAISAPVQSIYINPQITGEIEDEKIDRLASLLGESRVWLKNRFDPKSGRSFVYLKRQINPKIAEKVKELDIAGLDFQREFKRYYPSGEMAAHLLGFTNIDDVGQEGLELGYDHILQGVAGKKRVIRDGKKMVIGDVENIKTPISGKNLILSIDYRLQYFAYKELKAAVTKHKARSGSLVMLDAKTGDILAVVNQPAFNPNIREGLSGERYRNRAITDVFEPGSTVKPFVVAGALDGGFVNYHYSIDTTPGRVKIGRNWVRDVHNYGKLDLTLILKKSSNVAVSQIALKMPGETFWGYFNRLGFGLSANVGFPGEANGSLIDHKRLRPFSQATLSFGYGISTSVLQLARAYTALADDGLLHSVSLFKRERDADARQVFSPGTARAVRKMLEEVVQKDGTAYQARVDGYRIAGKTGTAKKAGPGGYSGGKYQAVFVGMAPAGNPRLVTAVMIDEPSAGDYYGGIVAAPVFSKVMERALRVMGIEPDQEDKIPVLLVRQGERA